MRRTAVLAALATAVLGVAAPAATADDPAFDCTLHAYSTHPPSPVVKHEHHGVAYGYVAHAEFQPVTIRCAVLVDGVDVSSTPAFSGTGTAATAGQIRYRSSDDQIVRLCAEATTSHGSVTRCEPVGETHLAPTTVCSPTVCPAPSRI